jgi:hypothetical protein
MAPFCSLIPCLFHCQLYANVWMLPGRFRAYALAALRTPLWILSQSASMCLFRRHKERHGGQGRHRLLRPRPGGGIRVVAQAARGPAGQEALSCRSPGDPVGVGGLAGHANATTRRLPSGLHGLPELRVVYPMHSYRSSGEMPRAWTNGLHQHDGHLYPTGTGMDLMWVTVTRRRRQRHPRGPLPEADKPCSRLNRGAWPPTATSCGRPGLPLRPLVSGSGRARLQRGALPAAVRCRACLRQASCARPTD